MSIVSTSPTVPGQPLPRFHIEAWLPFRNCEMVYGVLPETVLFRRHVGVLEIFLFKKNSFLLIYIFVMKCSHALKYCSIV